MTDTWHDREEHVSRMVAAQTGPNHANTSLTVSDVRNIRRMAAVGIELWEIAVEYDYPLNSIVQIVGRKTWANV